MLSGTCIYIYKYKYVCVHLSLYLRMLLYFIIDILHWNAPNKWPRYIDVYILIYVIHVVLFWITCMPCTIIDNTNLIELT